MNFAAPVRPVSDCLIRTSITDSCLFHRPARTLPGLGQNTGNRLQHDELYKPSDAFHFGVEDISIKFANYMIEMQFGVPSSLLRLTATPVGQRHKYHWVTKIIFNYLSRKLKWRLN